MTDTETILVGKGDNVTGQKAGEFYNSRQLEMVREASDNEILRVRVGSFLYGTETASSDVDYYTVWVPSVRSMIGLKHVEQIHQEGEEAGREYEVTRYPLHLIVRHMLKCNPNMLEVFYADQQNVLVETDLGRRLRRDPAIFLSAESCYKTFRGYAHEQRKKLTFKRERLFGFQEALATVDKWVADGRTTLPETVAVKSALNETGLWRSFEKGFDIGDTRACIVAALDEYGWRKELIVNHGFDVKFAANLVRILGESFDLFRFGEIRFPLSTRDSLREIRAGKWTLEQVLDCAAEWEKRVDEAYKSTRLPRESDFKGAEDLMVGIMADHWDMKVLLSKMQISGDDVISRFQAK